MPDAAVTDGPRDDSLVKAGALLLAGRQAGAALFMVAVLALPRFASRSTVDAVVWSVFAVLLLSTLLDLGLERAAAVVIADEARIDGRSGSVRSLLSFRLLTLPLTVGAVAAVLWLAGVHAGLAVVMWTAVWTAAVQVQVVAFAAHRAVRKRVHEPVAGFSGRVAQSALLLLLAAAHAGPGALIAAMALVDVVVAVCAYRVVVAPGPTHAGWVHVVGWRSLSMFTAVEVVAFAYLRADALIVARILGSGAGASYSLVYRLVDGVTALSTPFLLVVFPAAAGLVAAGRGVGALRARASRLAPAAGFVGALIALLLSVPLVALVPRIGEGAGALHVLLAAIPLLFYSAFELHLRSAEGDNARIVMLGTSVLILNVGMNLLLVPPFGMTGAAVALVCSEAAQAGWVLWSGPKRGSGSVAVCLGLSVSALLLVGRAIEAKDATMTVVFCVTALVATVYWLLRDGVSTYPME